MREFSKFCLHLAILGLFYTPVLFAQDCTQLPYDLENYTTKRQVSYSDMQSIIQLVKGQDLQSCNSDVLKPIIETIKEKRIETIKIYLRNGIKFEGNVDLNNELNYLNGAPTKFAYEFEGVFTLISIKKTPPPPAQNIVRPVPPKLEGEKTTSSVCSNKINENNAVNLENVRNQDSVGWCYAYAASELLSFRLNKRISAVSLFNAEGKSIEEDIRGGSKIGGDIEYSIRRSIARRKGLCLEEDLPSFDFKFCTDQKYLSFLNDIIVKAEQERFPYDLQVDSCLRQNLQSAYPGINITKIVNYVRQNRQSKLIEFIHDTQCKVHYEKESAKIVPISMTARDNNRPYLIKAINDQINKGDIAGIGYQFQKISGSDKEEDHGSVIVGRQTNPKTGACEYLVRNSWGKDCLFPESEGVSCHKTCSGGVCRNTGHFWISENRLSEALLNVTYLK